MNRTTLFLLFGLPVMNISASWADATLPCGPEEVFSYVGQQFNPALTDQQAFDAIFSPPVVDTSNAASPFYGLNPGRYATRRNLKCDPGDCDKYYAYGNFTETLKWIRGNMDKNQFPLKFGCEGTLTDRIRDVAEFFAHVAQETSTGTPGVSAGVAWGFGAKDECYHLDPSLPPGSLGACIRYDYDAVNNINYQGRGPHQLTGKGNYLWFGSLLKGTADTNDYVQNPDLLLLNPTTGWGSAVAFQMVNYHENGTTYSKPALHKLIVKSAFDQSQWGDGSHGEWGFGNTINSINGGVECASSTIDNRPMNRINNYIELLIRMGVAVQSVTLTKSDNSTATLSLTDLRKRIDSPWYDPKQYYEVLYLSQPIVDYFDQGGTGLTNLTQVRLQYVDDTNGLQDERLDCTGYKPYSQ